MENGNLIFYNQGRKVPEAAKKPIKGGRLTGMTDINPMWRIKMLTEMFGPVGFGWYYETTEKWEELQEGGEVLCFVKINLYISKGVGDQWSKPIEGTGGSKTVYKEKSGLYADDEAYKKATTDAIGTACKLIGIGADVYWDKDKTKYDSVSAPAEQAQTKPAQNQTDNEKNQQMIQEEGEKKIGQDHWNGLCRMAKDKGVSVKGILRQLNIPESNPGRMTMNQWIKVTKDLNALPDKEVK